ncbi:hypothetical protein DF212_00295 [Lactobacillus johnsonii]|nr:hypothetical protein DF212_00295 [Lactobacillus johnsonii]
MIILSKRKKAQIHKNHSAIKVIKLGFFGNIWPHKITHDPLEVENEEEEVFKLVRCKYFMGLTPK